jgi:hypothetical protein
MNSTKPFKVHIAHATYTWCGDAKDEDDALAKARQAMVAEGFKPEECNVEVYEDGVIDEELNSKLIERARGKLYDLQKVAELDYANLDTKAKAMLEYTERGKHCIRDIRILEKKNG